MPKMQQSCDILSMFYEEFSHIAFGKAVYIFDKIQKQKQSVTMIREQSYLILFLT